MRAHRQHDVVVLFRYDHYCVFAGCVVVVLFRLVWILYGSKSRVSSTGSSVPRKQRRHCG